MYRIGRSEGAEIRLADNTVSRVHAELVVGSDGLLLLIDRCSTGGTFHRTSGSGKWVRLRQGLVAAGDELRFGTHACRLRDLLLQVPAHMAPPKAGTEAPRADAPPSGPVRRDPTTGEILPTAED